MFHLGTASNDKINPNCDHEKLGKCTAPLMKLIQEFQNNASKMAELFVQDLEKACRSVSLIVQYHPGVAENIAPVGGPGSH